MSETGSIREKLVKIREDLATKAEDPSILEFDIDDPDVAVSLIMLATALKGGDMSITTEDENGRTETLTFNGLGTDSMGQAVLGISIGSSDGTISPETTDLATELLRPSFEAEVSRLTEGR